MSGKSSIRVASVQMALQFTPDESALFDRVAQFVAVAADYNADFVCFPEHITLQVLSGADHILNSAEAMDVLTALTPRWEGHLSGLASKHAINIVGGSHATRLFDGSVGNMAILAHRDGRLSHQGKLHPTPDERAVWKMRGADAIDAIDTDCGPVGIMICYDSEFPEVGRRLADQDAGLVFVPYFTDTRHGHFRVRYCCHARTVENQCYLVTSGLTGHVPNVENCNIAYAQSAILTPSDFPFARDGIAAEASENGEHLIVADLDMRKLDAARREGSVRNLADRRSDLYKVDWLKHRA